MIILWVCLDTFVCPWPQAFLGLHTAEAALRGWEFYDVMVV